MSTINPRPQTVTRQQFVDALEPLCALVGVTTEDVISMTASAQGLTLTTQQLDVHVG